MSIGLRKDTKTSHLGALAFPGTLKGIAQGTLLDFQQISHQLHLMTIFCVLRTWLWKHNTGDMLIRLMQAYDGDSQCPKQNAEACAKIKAPKAALWMATHLRTSRCDTTHELKGSCVS